MKNSQNVFRHERAPRQQPSALAEQDVTLSSDITLFVGRKKKALHEMRMARFGQEHGS
jgi:hypothetical protein